ncbi:PKD domain-containing protein [Methanofollis aquaemaris]|uniref:PKD domain-containing protein n=1 Tax=Methanofollis aquaemaris TaxID=126734 RepID=A0A8A3S552_9EURY|nr:NosD domain-containing protein [Methanofollis aquaemaris]QSZ66989.1 PKD domain-containing protein [Methanofollis aquaemaris]
MEKVPPIRRNIVFFGVLLAVLVCLVLPVTGGEEGAGLFETLAPPEPPANITNATTPALNLALAADPPTGPVPLTVRFSGAAAGLAVDLWTWTVDGVAAAGNESDFTHTFLEPGTHVVGLTAVNESASVTNTTAVDINVTAAPAPAAAPVVALADPPPGTHPRDWYVSPVPGTGNPHSYENITGLLAITDLGEGDTVHVWGAENHTYEGGITIDALNVTVQRWEGSPVQPLITNTSHTAPTFTVTADNATFLDLDISGNRLKYDNSRGAGIHAAGDPGTPLKCLTITDCTFAGNAVERNTTRGGAFYTEYVDDLQVEGTAFRGNFVAGGPGGGAYVWRCENATFTDTGFISNRAMAPYGGGAYFNESRNAAFTNVTFFDNYVWGSAGGARFEHCDAATFTDTVFIDNEVLASYGGADFEHCDALTLTNTSFLNNKAWSDGGGARFSGCANAILTNTTFTGNTATKWSGGGAIFGGCDNLTITSASFTDNSARHGGGANIGGCENATITSTAFTDNSALFGGGAYFGGCDAAAIVSSLFTNNTASQEGGGACFSECTDVMLTTTIFANNTAGQGGGAGFEECTAVMLTNCHLDNPTNIYASKSTAVLNTTRTPGTNIEGGPYLGGNLWLQDPEQNISEWCADADFDGICDQALTINNSHFGSEADGNRIFGIDHLPLVYGGTIPINATPSADGAFVFVDGTNTARTANNTFYLPVGDHLISVHKNGYLPGEKSVTIVPGENDPLTFDLTEITHPMNWYISPPGGIGNYTNISAIPGIGTGDIIHLWGVENYAYEGGIVIDAPNVTVQRWEGSPVQPLITNTSHTAPTFTVTADNATFRDLNISGNRLESGNGAGINAIGDPGTPLTGLTIIDCTFAGNAVEGDTTCGGAVSAEYVDDLLVKGTTFTGNSARGPGGGAYINMCENATLTSTAFTDNTAMEEGGGIYFSDSRNAVCINATLTTNHAGQGAGAYFENCDAATLTDTKFSGNTAWADGGGARFSSCDAATITNNTFLNNIAWRGGGAGFGGCTGVMLANCRFDNPTNIYAYGSTAVLNTTRTPGTNIGGGPYLGGNLWLRDPNQNISEWGTDADFDGICDQALTIQGLGTDHLPLVYGGTVPINATPSADGAFVFVDGTNTSRTANNTFYLPVGDHLISVQKEGCVPSVKSVTIIPGENDPLTFDLAEIIHPMNWYVSRFVGGGNFTSLLEITDLGEGDTVHIWGVEGHTYNGGFIIDKPNVTIRRWEGSPVRPLITNTSRTAPAFTVTADNATFCGLNISGNRLESGNGAGIHAAGATAENPLVRLTITDCTFAGNEVSWIHGSSPSYASGGALYAEYVDDLQVEGTVFTGNSALANSGGAYVHSCHNATVTTTSFTNNTAMWYGGGACFSLCDAATLTTTTFTNNTARLGGGGAYVHSCHNATITTTTFTNNTARLVGGGGAYIGLCENGVIANCRFDNPTNIHAYGSTAVLNTTRTPGTNIAGGPYLGGNLWLRDPNQNISEWGTDADFDGICDQNLTIDGLGTDHLPLMYDGDRGTALIRASALGGFVYVDGVNTTRTADFFATRATAVAAHTPPSGAFFLPAGTHTVEVVGATTYGRAVVEISAGTTERVTVEVGEVDVRGYAAPRQGSAPLNVSFDTGFTGPAPDRIVWTFGEGNESSPCYWPFHTYEKAGTYIATLTAGWGEGSDLVRLVRTVEIVVGMPDPGPGPGPEPVLYLSATEGNAPFTVGVNVGSAGTPERWRLDLGDGRAINGTTPAEINRSVTYDTPGTYLLTLTVSTGEATNATTRTVTVLAPPAADFNVSPVKGNAPLDVAFTDRSTGDISARSWDFGDGATSTDLNPAHRYEQAGTYTVRLTVSNAYGASTAEQTVIVSTPRSNEGRSTTSAGGRSTASSGSAGKIPAGGTASLTLPNSAIYEVRVTAGEEIPEVMITVGKTSRPGDVDAPAGSVYEYAEVTLYRTTDDAIEGAVFSFSVPKTWLDEHGLDPADVVLYRYHDGEWQPLSTEVVREDETSWHFSARSPGFSLFAIGGEPSAVETPVMTPAAPADTVETLTTPPAAAGPTPPNTPTPFPSMLLVVGGALALLLVAVVVRRMR